MTSEQRRVYLRFVRLVSDAHKAGFVVAVDSDAVAIRLIVEGDATRSSDLRQLGEVIRVDDACGGSAAVVSSDACSYGCP